MTEEIRPCPCCNGESVIQKWNGFYIKCTNGGCGLIQPDFNTREEAISAWNRRTLPEVTEEEIKQVVHDSTLSDSAWKYHELNDDADLVNNECNGLAQSILAMLKKKGVCK
jgi:hypothetical protein